MTVRTFAGVLVVGTLVIACGETSTPKSGLASTQAKQLETEESLSEPRLEELNFPKSWEGSWSGDCGTFEMGLNIAQIGSSNSYSWQLVYPNGLRNYTLNTIDAANGVYEIDENNGFIIEYTFEDNLLDGSFIIDSQNSTELRNTVEVFEDGSMRFVVGSQRCTLSR